MPKKKQWKPFQAESITNELWPGEMSMPAERPEFLNPHFISSQTIEGLYEKTKKKIAKVEAILDDYKQELQGIKIRGVLFNLSNYMEALNSSRIEGIDNSFAYLVSRENGENPMMRDKYQLAGETLANLQAVKLGVGSIASGSITLELLDEIQEEITRDTGVRSGGIRAGQVVIAGKSGIICVPPAASKLGGYLDDLAEFILRDDIENIIHIALAHAQFEGIHPYEDGNGRTGRCLSYLMFYHKFGFPLPMSVGLFGARSKYYDALNDFRDGHLDSIIELHLDSIETFCKSSLPDFKELADYLEHIIAELSQSALPYETPEIVKWAAGHPIVNYNSLTAAFRLSETDAINLLEQFEKAGFLKASSDLCPSNAPIKEMMFEVHEIINTCEYLEKEVRENTAKAVKCNLSLTTKERVAKNQLDWIIKTIENKRAT